MVEKGSDALAATDASVDNGGASTEEGAGSIVDGDSAEVPGRMRQTRILLLAKNLIATPGMMVGIIWLIRRYAFR